MYKIGEVKTLTTLFQREGEVVLDVFVWSFTCVRWQIVTAAFGGPGNFTHQLNYIKFFLNSHKGVGSEIYKIHCVCYLGEFFNEGTSPVSLSFVLFNVFIKSRVDGEQISETG